MKKHMDKLAHMTVKLSKFLTANPVNPRFIGM